MDTTKYILDRPPYREIVQLHQKLPFISNLYTKFEKNYDVLPIHTWSQKAWPFLPIAIVVVYLALIFAGKKLFEDRKPFGDNNRKFLAAWNFFLSTFSFLGAFRTVPHLLYNIKTLPFQENVCLGINDSNWGTFSTGFWVQVFIFSKVSERSHWLQKKTQTI